MLERAVLVVLALTAVFQLFSSGVNAAPTGGGGGQGNTTCGVVCVCVCVCAHVHVHMCTCICVASKKLQCAIRNL